MKLKNILLALLVLLLAGMTIRTCKLERELETSEHSLQFLIDHPTVHTDTVWETKPISLPKALPDEVIPSRVIHPQESKSLTEGSRPSSQLIEESDSGPSQRDSLTGINLNQNKFTLTFQNPTFGYHQSEYQIKPQEYQYTWVDGKLTAKRLSLAKRLELKPYTSLSYRPIHNLWDLEVGISFKTKSLNYNLGLSGFYYPQWQSKPGLDATIRITYNF